MLRWLPFLLLASFIFPQDGFAQKNALQWSLMALKVGGSNYANGQLAYFRETVGHHSASGVKLGFANRQILPFGSQSGYNAAVWANMDIVHRFTMRKLGAKNAWMFDLGISVLAEHKSERYPGGFIECATGMSTEEMRRYSEWLKQKKRKTYLHSGLTTALYWTTNIRPNISVGIGSSLSLYFQPGDGAWLSAAPAFQGISRF